MTKRAFFCLIIIFLTQSIFPQNFDGLYGDKAKRINSVMISGLGPNFMLGDIGGYTQHFFFWNLNNENISNASFFSNISLLQLYPTNFGMREEISVGTVKGKDTGENILRGFSFKSNFIEACFEGEYVLFGNPYNEIYTPHFVYIYAGVGLIKCHVDFNGELRGTDILNTDVLAPIIPFGVGYKYKLTNKFSLGFELSYQYALTDFLDGVTTKNSNENDILAGFNFTLTYKIFGGPNRDFL